MLRAAPAIVVAVALAVFAWHPSGLPQAFMHQDKLVHLLGFAALACALRLGLPDLSRQEYAGALLLAASAIELGQTFLPTRTGSLGDLLADGVGAVFGLALADALRQWRCTFPPFAAPESAAIEHVEHVEHVEHDDLGVDVPMSRDHNKNERRRSARLHPRGANQFR